MTRRPPRKREEEEKKRKKEKENLEKYLIEMQRFSKGYKTPLQTLAKGHIQAVHPLRHMQTHTHTSAGRQAVRHTRTHAHTQIHTQAPKGKCRYTNISALQPKTVSLC